MSFGPAFFYRPALRTQSSDRVVHSSDAAQFGLSLAVDITIFEVSHSTPATR